MTNLPDVGSTVHLHGGSILRTDETHLTLIRADGVRDYSHNRCAKVEVRFAAAVNVLRRYAALESLPLPCLYCLEKPRRGSNTFCSGQCEALHYGRPVPHVKALKSAKGTRYQPRTEQPLPPIEIILKRLQPFADLREPKVEPVKPEPVEKLPAAFTVPARVSPGIARLEADALIVRRGGKVPRNNYCRPERYEGAS